MNPIETDIQLAIMVGNRDFLGAADYAMRTQRVHSASRGKTRRRRMRMLVAVLRAAARVPAARPDAVEIYRAHRPRLSMEEALFLRNQLGEDFDVLPVGEDDVVDEISLTNENPLDDGDILSESRLPPPPPGSPERFGYGCDIALELDSAFDRLTETGPFDRSYEEWLERQETDPYAAALPFDEDAETDPVIPLIRFRS